jgi:hypothetical protein
VPNIAATFTDAVAEAAAKAGLDVALMIFIMSSCAVWSTIKWAYSSISKDIINAAMAGITNIAKDTQFPYACFFLYFSFLEK